MAQATTYQCPNCSGVLEFDVQSGLLTCTHCGSTYSAGEIERAIPVNAEGVAVKAQSTEHVTTVEEFLEHAPWEVAGANAAQAIEYSCPSCGAGVIADQSAVTATCPYCGNNMLVSGIATPENIPAKIVPFSISREQAMEHMHEHFRHKWYLSRKFSAQVEHLQGVYVPYHLYDMHVQGWADYIGNEKTNNPKGESIEASHIALHRAGYADISMLPVDGSSNMPDGHMDAIAPFDFSKMRDFSPDYVAGYLAEVADESIEACAPSAKKRARDSFVEELAADARKTERVDSVDSVKSRTDVKVTHATTCALPVWLMHCSWAGNQMLFAVNGETGKCVGDLPIDKARRTITLVIGLIIALALAGPLLFEMAVDDDMPGFMIVIAIAIFALPFAVDAFFRSQMRTAVKAQGDGLDYSTEGLVVTESWNGPKFHMTRKKALADLDERPR